MANPSKASTLRVAATPRPIPTPIAPLGGARLSGPTLVFRWSDPDGVAPAYYVQVAADSSFTDIKLVVLAQTGLQLGLTEVPLGTDQVLHWRVRRQEGGRWSPPATFEVDQPAQDGRPAVPAKAATTSALPSSAGPVAVSPVEGEPVCGSAATFEWMDPSFDGTSTYQVQVSHTDTFGPQTLTVQAGRTMVLSLMGLLPEDGHTYFWRVGRDQGVQTQWGPVSTCRLVTDDEATAWNEEQERLAAKAEQRARTQQGLSEEEVEATAPWRVGFSKTGWSAAVIFYMVATFLLFVAVLMAL